MTKKRILGKTMYMIVGKSPKGDLDLDVERVLDYVAYDLIGLTVAICTSSGYRDIKVFNVRQLLG